VLAPVMMALVAASMQVLVLPDLHAQPVLAVPMVHPVLVATALRALVVPVALVLVVTALQVLGALGVQAVQLARHDQQEQVQASEVEPVAIPAAKLH